MKTIKRQINNAKELRSTRPIAKRLYKENFSSFSLKERVEISHSLEFNFLSSEFYKTYSDFGISYDDYVETLLFCLDNLKLYHENFRVTIENEKFGHLKIKSPGFIAYWINIYNYFNDERINNKLYELFLNLDNIYPTSQVYTIVKEFIRNRKTFFDNEYTKHKEEYEDFLYRFYLKYNDNLAISLCNERTMQNAVFLDKLSRTERLDFRMTLVDCKNLHNIPEEDRHKIHIIAKNKDEYNENIHLLDLGFNIDFQYHKTLKLKELTHLSDKGRLGLNDVCNFLDRETNLFLVKEFHFKSLKNNNDFISDILDFTDEEGFIDDGYQKVLLMKYAE